MEKAQPYIGSCHCGNVQFELTKKPQWLVSCNCSICSRLGVIWAHVESSDVKLMFDRDKTIAYIWGDKTLAIHTCNNCGCTTHWESLDRSSSGRMAINFLMCRDHDISEFRLRKFDGTKTWKFID